MEMCHMVIVMNAPNDPHKGHKKNYHDLERKVKHLEGQVVYHKLKSKYRLEGLIFATGWILWLLINTVSLAYILNSRAKSAYALHIFNMVISILYFLSPMGYLYYKSINV